ncbi:MAG: hypothetical protein IIV40_04660 [Oscillospiraceae bacterium]|nr:hypothetical protein [Oscillospiraceae bacterium]MBQ5667449.1 hypothetical protein [Oscillospiraceae bacterium]MBQ5897789.1 hypothetical protein [Oscillospiraceae bacterium]MBQ6580220.1 hypothetical protein [Oscillospiraceae bacterium]
MMKIKKDGGIHYKKPLQKKNPSTVRTATVPLPLTREAILKKEVYP